MSIMEPRSRPIGFLALVWLNLYFVGCFHREQDTSGSYRVKVLEQLFQDAPVPMTEPIEDPDQGLMGVFALKAKTKDLLKGSEILLDDVCFAIKGRTLEALTTNEWDSYMRDAIGASSTDHNADVIRGWRLVHSAIDFPLLKLLWSRAMRVLCERIDHQGRCLCLKTS